MYNVCDMSGDTLAKWTPDKPAASKQILVKCPAGVRLRVTYSENGVYQVDKSKCEEVRDAGCLKRILNDKGELNFQMSFESVLPYLTTMRGGKRVPRIYRGKGKDIFQQTGSHDHRYRNFSEHCSREKWYLPCEYWSTETKDIRTVATGGQVAVKTSSDLEIYQDGSWELSAGNPTRGASSPPIGYTYSCRQEQSSTRPRAGKPAHRTLWDDSGSVAVPSGWLYGAPLHWFTRIVLRKADQLEKFTKGKTKVNGHVKWQEQGNSFSGYLVSRSGPWDQLDGDQCEERDRALRYSEGFYHFANDPVRWASGAGCYWRHYEDEGPVLNKEFTYEIEYLDMKEDE